MHTVATRRQRGAVAAIHGMRVGSERAVRAWSPPGNTIVSIRSSGPGSGSAPRTTPLPARTGRPSTETSRTAYPDAGDPPTTRVAAAKTS